MRNLVVILGWIHHRRGDLDASFDHSARALALALNLHPKLVIDTLSRIVDLAKEVAAAGKMVEVARLGQGMLEVVKHVNGQGWKNEEVRAIAGLCQEVFAVITLLGLSADLEAEKQMEARAQALEGAKGVDKVTQGVWGLEAWIKVLLEGQGQKDLEL